MKRTTFIAVLLLIALSVVVDAKSKVKNLKLQPAKYVSVTIGENCASNVHEVMTLEAAHHTEVFPVTRPLKFDVNDYPFDLHQLGMLGTHAGIASQRLMLTYQDSQGNEWGHVFLDPRIRFADGIRGSMHAHEESDGEPVPGAFFYHKEDADVFHLPLDATNFKVYCRNTTSHVKHSLTERRRFHVSEDGGSIDMSQFHVDAKNFIGPNTTQNAIIFVSGGFTSEEEKLFNETVDAVLQLLPDPDFNSDKDAKEDRSQNMKNMHKSVPFDRYWQLFNVYSVFQPSPQSGASRPKFGVEVKNNLDCFHPEEMERAVSCSWEKAIALADLAPAPVRAIPDRCLVITIVNTNIYGGTGMSKRGKVHVGNFYTGLDEQDDGTFVRDNEKYASLVNHEVGHAYGGLIDEYDLGFSEPTTIEFPNCQAPAKNGGPPNPPQWQHWIEIMSEESLAKQYRGEIVAVNDENGASIEEWNTAKTPLPVCLYSNYYKSNEYCMMNRLRNFYMCPVCRESSTMEVMILPFQYQWPRFPLPDQILVIPTAAAASAAGIDGFVTTEKGVALHLPFFLTEENDFTVTWQLGDKILTPIDNAGCPQCLLVDSTMLANTADFPREQVAIINVTITDGTNQFISAKKRGDVEMLVQKTSFRIMVTESDPNDMEDVIVHTPVQRRKGNFGLYPSTDALSTFQMCVAENPSIPKICKLDFTIKTYEAPEDLDALISEYDQWVLYIVGAVGLFFLLLWVWAWSYYKKKSQGVVRPIFETEFTGVVKVIRYIMKISAILFMLASLSALGISVYYYTKLSALGKILIIIGVTMAFGLYVMAFIGYWAVAYRSKRLLLVNGGVLFFGLLFLVTLAALVVSLGKDIQEEDSFWTNQLRTFWTDLVADNPERACAIQGMLSCSGFTYTCDGRSNVVSTVYCPINCEKTNEKFATACKKVLQDAINNSYFTAVLILSACIVMMFFAIIFNFTYYFKLMQMKKEIREQNNARVHRHTSQRGINSRAADSCRALYILKTLDDGDLNKLKKEFRRIDADGNGELDRSEFVLFFKKALCYRPTAAEIDKIFQVADIDGDGTISMEEFLAIFKSGSRPSAAGDESTVLKGRDANRADEISRRMAKHYGNTGLVDSEMPQKPGAAAGGPKPASKPAAKRAYRPPSDRPPTPPGLL